MKRRLPQTDSPSNGRSPGNKMAGFVKKKLFAKECITGSLMQIEPIRCLQFFIKEHQIYIYIFIDIWMFEVNMALIIVIRGFTKIAMS